MESTHNEGVAVGSRMSRMSHGVGFGPVLAISCLISYWLITTILAREYSVSHDNDLLGGMWAVVATIFVFRHRALQRVARPLRGRWRHSLASHSASYTFSFSRSMSLGWPRLSGSAPYFGSVWPFRRHRDDGHYDCRSVRCCRNK